MNTLKRKIVWIPMLVCLLLVLGFGVFKFVTLQKRMYNTIVLHGQSIVILQDFLQYTFPDQAKTYKEAVNAKMNGESAVQLPTNGVVK